ncbi:MAG TPA: hypothetical protein PLA50_09125 [Bacteroidia bacterium]|nr:hypothetical protein [Bacteroidia bacterium]
MSLFSRKPKNRRRRRILPKKSNSILDAPEAKPSKIKKKSGDLVEQVYQLNAQIGVLESFIAKKTSEQITRERMKHEGIMPPPERAGARRRAKRPPLSQAEQRRYHAERSKGGIHFFVLFCLACALVWWLI